MSKSLGNVIWVKDLKCDPRAYRLLLLKSSYRNIVSYTDELQAQTIPELEKIDTAMNKFVRPDGSVNHIVSFDPNNGEVLETPAGQGYASGSSWSRGQAWALYGFALSYIHTNKQEYLDNAKKYNIFFSGQS